MREEVCVEAGGPPRTGWWSQEVGGWVTEKHRARRGYVQPVQLRGHLPWALRHGVSCLLLTSLLSLSTLLLLCPTGTTPTPEEGEEEEAWPGPLVSLGLWHPCRMHRIWNSWGPPCWGDETLFPVSSVLDLGGLPDPYPVPVTSRPREALCLPSCLLWRSHDPRGWGGVLREEGRSRPGDTPADPWHAEDSGAVLHTRRWCPSESTA